MDTVTVNKNFNMVLSSFGEGKSIETESEHSLTNTRSVSRDNYSLWINFGYFLPGGGRKTGGELKIVAWI